MKYFSVLVALASLGGCASISKSNSISNKDVGSYSESVHFEKIANHRYRDKSCVRAMTHNNLVILAEYSLMKGGTSYKTEDDQFYYDAYGSAYVYSPSIGKLAINKAYMAAIITPGSGEACGSELWLYDAARTDSARENPTKILDFSAADKNDFDTTAKLAELRALWDSMYSCAGNENVTCPEVTSLLNFKGAAFSDYGEHTFSDVLSKISKDNSVKTDHRQLIAEIEEAKQREELEKTAERRKEEKKKQARLASQRKFKDAQSEELESLNASLKALWNVREIMVKGANRGDKVCSYSDNKMGYIDEFSGDNVRVLWKRRMDNYPAGFWFGNVPFRSMSTTTLGAYEYKAIPIDEVSWAKVSEIGTCNYST